MKTHNTTKPFREDQLSRKLPKVSVCVVTYNQHKYIADCLQSIVDQETDFEFEIIVGDDFSTDGTQEVVRSFGEKYPSLFRLFLQGTSKNELFQAAAYCTKKPPLRRRVVQGRTTN